MKTKSRLTLALLMLSSLFTSCTYYFYYPFKQNTLNFEEKGDLQVGYSLDGIFKSFNVGTALTDNVGLIVDGNFMEGPFSEKPSTYILDSELVLFKKYDSNVLTELNIGYGYGKKRWRDVDALRFTLQRPFIQPSIGYVKKYFEIGLSSRISYLQYDFFLPNSFNEDYESNNYITARSILANNRRRDFWFVEPALSAAVKYNGLKLQCQFVRAKQLTTRDIDYVDGSLILSLNYTFNLNRLFKKE